MQMQIGSSAQTDKYQLIFKHYYDALVYRAISIDLGIHQNSALYYELLKARLVELLMVKLSKNNQKQLIKFIGQAYMQLRQLNSQEIFKIQCAIRDIIQVIKNEKYQLQDQFSQFSIQTSIQNSSNVMGFQSLLQISQIQPHNLENDKIICISLTKQTQTQIQNDAIQIHQQQEFNQQQFDHYKQVDDYLYNVSTCRHQINILCQQMKFNPVQYLRYCHMNRYYVRASIDICTKYNRQTLFSQGYSANYKHACEQAAFVLLRTIYYRFPDIWTKIIRIKRLKGITN